MWNTIILSLGIISSVALPGSFGFYEPCRTKSLGGRPCAFPYVLDGSLEWSCTRNYKNDGRLEGWCPTVVEPGSLSGRDWYECDSESRCPLLQYSSNAEAREHLRDLAENYPRLSRAVSIGKSALGAPLAGIVMSGGLNVGPREALKPMVKLLGNMHGNEPVGRELLLHFARHLLGSYGLDERITHFLNNTELWIIPSSNPDGFARASEGSCEGGGYPEVRYNEGRVDLNRDFPTWKEVNSTDLTTGRQPETLALMSFIMDHPFVLSANFHDGAVLVNYPWDDYHSTDTRTWVGLNKAPDHEVFYRLSTTYSFNHGSMRNPDSCTKWGVMENGVTNGADWYPVIGGMQDFNYLFSNALEVTMELSCCKYPRSKVLLKEWDKNREALISYIEQVHSGLKGLVTDSSGARIPGATLQFRSPASKEPIGKDVKASEDGEFWKILNEDQRVEFRGIKQLRNGRVLESQWVNVLLPRGQREALRMDLELL
eukprot:TRINITY_DN2522_c0_g1_i1.p1 TRINITY_DN2522_c0_g1~~TRINITY_DN2522_c0_g1_i1.p1  ORF type:complete len:485 (-),score=130.93 TRINITY_DN2522_c0_g1_i1:115-1569(-)